MGCALRIRTLPRRLYFFPLFGLHRYQMNLGALADVDRRVSRSFHARVTLMSAKSFVTVMKPLF